MEKGVCSITRTYTPELVRQRAFATPQATFQIVVRRSRKSPLGLAKRLVKQARVVSLYEFLQYFSMRLVSSLVVLSYLMVCHLLSAHLPSCLCAMQLSKQPCCSTLCSTSSRLLNLVVTLQGLLNLFTHVSLLLSMTSSPPALSCFACAPAGLFA